MATGLLRGSDGAGWAQNRLTIRLQHTSVNPSDRLPLGLLDVRTTTTIAFGGYFYSIAKWLPSHVIHYSAGLFGFSQRWCRDFAATIRNPVTLIGFSEGANAAMSVASHSPMVTRAIVHSCEDKPTPFNAGCDYRFFVTSSDKTPTLDGTVETALRAMKQRIEYQIQFLSFKPFENPTWFERNILAPKRHIFHNVLSQLSLLGV